MTPWGQQKPHIGDHVFVGHALFRGDTDIAKRSEKVGRGEPDFHSGEMHSNAH
jgi:hypothetical protein